MWFSDRCKKDVCVGKNNVFMCGFRDYLLDKYIQKVHPYGYICVVYVQHENGGKITRKLHEIYTPATTFIDDSNVLSNNITCVWIQKSNALMSTQFIFGISNIDIYTGKTNMCEYYESYYHNPTTYDSIEKFISVYNPIELVLIHNIECEIVDNIIQYLNCKSKRIHKISLLDTDNELSTQAKNCESQVYQNEIIDRFYPHIQNKETFKYSLFEKTVSFQSFCFLLNFVQQHNSSLISRIKEPCIENELDMLICANHSLKQLNILESNDACGDYSSVLTFLNRCKTKMGKRYMNEILLNPRSDIAHLKESYQAIEYFIQKKYNFNDLLVNVKDIEKMTTKIKIKKSTPFDFACLYHTMTLIKKINDRFGKDTKIYEHFNINKENVLHCIQSCKDILDEYFDIQVASEVTNNAFEKFPTVNHQLIKRGKFKKLDKESTIKVEYRQKLNMIIKYLNKTFEEYLVKQGKSKSKTPYIKIHELASSEMLIIITKKRRQVLKDIILEMDNTIHTFEFQSNITGKTIKFDFDINSLTYKDYNKTDSSIHCELLDEIVRSIYNTNIKFNDILYNCYQNIFDIFIKSQYDNLCYVVEFIKELDVLNTKSIVSSQFNYCKPKIVKKKQSFLKCKKLRHPLIEHIETNEIYVANDISLGTNDKNLGVLLFGTNAVGKTSFIKSIGIAVIMAQSGFFVPCESMEFMPYNYIFTRIIGNDNLFKGLSTFGVEMSELRIILNHCNENSLILGDELCSGTEIDSALAIFLSGLEIMSNNKSSFIFATHFHQIKDFDEIKKMNSINLKHMKVLYNHETQKLVYDRKLNEGAGDSIYGLEVCKSLNMPDDFIARCYEIRNKHMNNVNNILTFKVCKYNNKKVRGICEICKEEKEVKYITYNIKRTLTKTITLTIVSIKIIKQIS